MWATLLLFSFLFSAALSQEETLCQGQVLNMTVQQKTVISDCLAENGIKSIWKIPPEKTACFGVCALKRKGHLTPEGKLDHYKIFNYVEVVMKPDSVKAPLRQGIDKCFKAHGDKIADSNDEKCTAFANTGQCVNDIFFKLCFT